jgi:hypothetical protein
MSMSVLQRLALSDRSRAALQDAMESLFGARRTESGSIAWAPVVGGIIVTLVSIWLRQQSNQRNEGRRRGRRASNV